MVLEHFQNVTKLKVQLDSAEVLGMKYVHTWVFWSNDYIGIS